MGHINEIGKFWKWVNGLLSGLKTTKMRNSWKNRNARLGKKKQVKQGKQWSVRSRDADPTQFN